MSLALVSLAIAAGAMAGRTKKRFRRNSGAMIELMGDNKQNQILFLKHVRLHFY